MLSFAAKFWNQIISFWWCWLQTLHIPCLLRALAVIYTGHWFWLQFLPFSYTISSGSNEPYCGSFWKPSTRWQTLYTSFHHQFCCVFNHKHNQHQLLSLQTQSTTYYKYNNINYTISVLHYYSQHKLSTHISLSLITIWVPKTTLHHKLTIWVGLFRPVMVVVLTLPAAMASQLGEGSNSSSPSPAFLRQPLKPRAIGASSCPHTST